MVTVDQLKEWDADRLGVVADELHSRRSALTDLSGELDTGRPPGSWVGGASVYAEQKHDLLANQLTDQVAELNLVISALDTASGDIRGARSQLDDALSRASSAGCTVSSSGEVTSNRTYTDEDELADAQRVVDEIAQSVADALSRAADADSALASTLGSAHSSDVDAGGDLGDQALPDALRGLSTEEQVDYLLDHPDLSDIVVPSLPEPLREALGVGLSDLLDSEVNDEDFNLEQGDVDRLSGLLDAYGGDDVIAASMYDDLGPDGTVATLGSIESYLRLGGMDNDSVMGLAEDMRRTLGVASGAPGFDSQEFGRDITRYATYQLDDDQRDAYEDRYGHVGGSSGASILTYLMQDHNLDGNLVQGVAEQLDVFERSDSYLGAREWYSHTGYSPLTAGEEFSGYADDPMAAALGNLGDHPQDAYQFLTDDPSRQDFYFHERNWENDGFAGITELAEGLGTDPEMLEQHPEETAEIVSRFFHGIATNESFSVDNAEAGSPHLAELMKHYTPAVDAALRNPDDTGEPGAGAFSKEYFGSFEHYPIMFDDDLEDLMQVSVSTEDGATSIAEGIGAYQQTQVNNVAAVLAENPNDPQTMNELRDVLEHTAGLQGFAEHAVGSVEISDAQDHDARVQAFSDLIGEAAGLVPLPGAGIGGEVLSAAWDQGVDLGTGAFSDAYGSQTEAVTANAENRAQAGVSQLRVSTFLSLVDAGVIPEADIPDMWRDDNGNLIREVPEGQLASFAQSASDGVNNFVTSHDLETAYKNEFIRFYEQSDG